MAFWYHEDLLDPIMTSRGNTSPVVLTLPLVRLYGREVIVQVNRGCSAETKLSHFGGNDGSITKHY